MKNLLKPFLLVTAFLVSACASLPQPQAPANETSAEAQLRIASGRYAVGDNVVVIVYCNTDATGFSVDFDDLVQYFIDEVGSNGFEGYMKFMNDPSTPCRDARIHPISPISVELAELLGEFEEPEGTVFQVWRISDAGGQNGFTWTAVPGQNA